MPGSAAVAIELTDDERAQLEAWTRRRTSAQALAQRSRIVLLAAEGLTNTAIAERLGVHRPMVTKWRSRFAEHRLDGLTDEPRPGRPRTVTDEQVEEVIVRTLETTPRDATHWSTRSMARELGLSQSAVLRIWRAFGLQPHRQETWKLSKDPLFVAKVRDVVALKCTQPVSDAARHAGTSQPRLRASRHFQPVCRPGSDDREGHRIPACTRPLPGVLGIPHEDRRCGPTDLDVHLVLDNASTHKTPGRHGHGGLR